MAYAQVSYGSTGSSVSALQEKLNQNGYDLAEDGVFGAETRKAVKDYQKKKGLQVDGIAGTETWGSLMKSPAANPGSTTGKQVLSGVSDETSDRLYALEQGYVPSDEVKAAQAERDSVAAARPDAYQSSFEEELLRLYDELVQRPGFSYDLAGDPLYWQYRDSYTRQGRLAMEDTMGRAAGLTGGYGSTYSQAAGQQSHHGYLQGLHDRIPQLYELALSRYAREGQELKDQYGLLRDLEAEAYGRYDAQYDA